MFDSFYQFVGDFNEKIGDKLPWRTTHSNKKINVRQTKTTERRSIYDGWYDVNEDWEEDFDVLREEIIEAVSVLYFNKDRISNRFLAQDGGIDTSWIGSVDYDSYRDYYDCGEIREFTIYLDKLYELIKEAN